MIAGKGKVEDGIGDGCCTGSYSQAADTSFEGCYTVFKYALGGVGQTAVDVARVTEPKTVSGMLAVLEHIGCGLVNRYGP